MKVIFFNGNLGNQVFYCAFKDYLYKINPQKKVYRYITHLCPPVTVDKYFNLTLPEKNIYVNVISFIVFYIETIFKKIFRLSLPVNIVCSHGDIKQNATFFNNYLQDKFFYENLESKWLQIRMPIHISPEYLKYEKLIHESSSICVHIRRGDYIKYGSAYVDLSSTNYYRDAIKIAKEKYPTGKLFFFSDDLDFVRNHFGDSDSYYVDCNRGSESYLDIKLMSMAKVNIMANSTFSYWGAYIGHEYKTVIYPKDWFRKETGRTIPNIMLDTWIGL